MGTLGVPCDVGNPDAKWCSHCKETIEEMRSRRYDTIVSLKRRVPYRDISWTTIDSNDDCTWCGKANSATRYNDDLDEKVCPACVQKYNSPSIDALYTINKYAKEKAENGTKCYKSGEKARAKVHSVRKTALYAVKSIAIHRLVKADPDNVIVKKHEIDDEEFWCFCFETFGQSFHQPVEAVVSDAIDTIANADGRVESDDVAEIERQTDVPDDLPDLESTLETLAADHGIDANDYLTQNRVTESTGPLSFELVEYPTKFDIDSSL